jgi:hypothetical protein
MELSIYGHIKNRGISRYLEIKKLPAGNFSLPEDPREFSRPEKSIKDFSGSKSATARCGKRFALANWRRLYSRANRFGVLNQI